jgi:hypothetical protein
MNKMSPGRSRTNPRTIDSSKVSPEMITFETSPPMGINWTDPPRIVHLFEERPSSPHMYITFDLGMIGDCPTKSPSLLKLPISKVVPGQRTYFLGAATSARFISVSAIRVRLVKHSELGLYDGASLNEGTILGVIEGVSLGITEGVGLGTLERISLGV